MSVHEQSITALLAPENLVEIPGMDSSGQDLLLTRMQQA